MRREELLSIGQAAEMLGVPVSTLRYWADHNLIPVVKTPAGTRRFFRPVIEAKMRDMGYPVEESEVKPS